MKKINQFLTIFFMISSFTVSASAEDNNVAVLDFHAKDVPAKQASIITDIVRGTVVKSGKYTVLDRANMDSILKEQSFQQTGCTDAACAVKIGKLLSMKYMIVGTLSKLGSTYILSAELISVESGKIVKSEDGNSKTIDEIINVAKDAANRLVGAAPSATFTQPVVTQTAASREKIGGEYFARGTNPDGSSYSGNVSITKKDESYKFVWKIGSSTYYGVGVLKGDILTVDWGQADPVIYKVMPDGTLDGKWAGGKAGEILKPF